jgi:hypothetical protein
MKKILLSHIIFMCLIGCAMYKVYYAYNVSAKNAGERKLRDIIITSDIGFWHATGYLNKGAEKTLGGLKPVPPNGIYSIVVENLEKERHTSVIDLHNKIKKGFRGEIVFLVDKDYHVTYELE